mmetsp:Transcript_18136/g.32473  ORF Transcript_18136/g.32473 Transcript_18136/m.32473 type:complete len:560 (+) Transcript_18136:1607-3286(+)
MNTVDIEVLARVCMRNIQGFSGMRIQPPQQALSLLEDLEQAEKWEHELFQHSRMVGPDEPTIVVLPTLPKLPTLNLTTENPKSLIFKTLLKDQSYNYLVDAKHDSLGLLQKAVAHSSRSDGISSEEVEILRHCLDTRLDRHLQQFLLHSYQVSPEKYTALVKVILTHDAVFYALNKLPVLTDDVWNFLVSNPDYDRCFKIVEHLVLAFEDVATGLECVFKMLEAENNALNVATSKFIANKLHRLVPLEIESRVTESFRHVSTETLPPYNIESKVQLYFALLEQNPDLVTVLLDVYPEILNPLTKTVILKHFENSIKNYFPQSHPELLNAVKVSSLNSKFMNDFIPIVSRLQNLSGELKEEIQAKIVSENAFFLLSSIAFHFNTEDLKLHIGNILTLDHTQRENCLNKVLEGGHLDPAYMVELLHCQESDLKLTIETLKDLLENKTAYFTADVLKRASLKVAQLEPVSMMSMYFMLKVHQMYPDLKVELVEQVMPAFLNKKLWEQPRLWKGCVTFLERTVPESIALLQLLPPDVQRQLETSDIIRKGKLDYQLRSSKTKV